MDKIHQSCDIHFESLMVNEFHGREFECGQYIPSGPGFEKFPLKIKFVQQLDLLLEAQLWYRIYKIGLSILFFTLNGETLELPLHLLFSWEFSLLP